MNSQQQGRVVVITGANRGIGHEMARTLLEDGYRVAGLDIEGEYFGSLATAHPEQARYHDCDVTSGEDVEEAVEVIVEEWGQIDILVNNAAVLDFGFFEEQTLEDTRETFEVNYFGYLRTIRAVLPHMRERGSGIVHNVSSGVGLVGNPGLTGYGATKGAIEAFTRSLRLELQRENVAVTVMHPRLAKTQGAAELGYPDSQTKEPAYVGRKLAGKIESRKRVIYTDWVTRLGLAFAKRFPFVVRKASERFLDEREASTAGSETDRR